MTPVFWLSVLLGAVPAAYAWWSGRSVQRALDDPTLPEQLLERQKRLLQVTIVVLIAGALVPTPTGFTLAVLLAVLVAQYPTRRAVYGDTWPLWRYVRFTSFATIAFAGLWLFPLIASSLVVQIARAWSPEPSRERTLLGIALGVAAAVVYLLWSRNFVRAWLALNHASPIEASGPRAPLLQRFEAILDRAGDKLSGRPTLHRYGVAGGRVVNAVALCSLHGRAVAMSDTLLDNLDDDEAAAILAHEVAHHEHYGDALLRRRRWASRILALLLVLIPPLELAIGHGWDVAVDVLFLVVILALFSRGQSRHQKHETECDLRAVELTGGDAESVIRALTKIHALGRMPRRFSQEFERAASHPSLARRIQAIRGHASAASPSSDAPTPAPTILASRTAGSWVALDERRIHWFEGVPAGTPLDVAALRDAAASYRALAYAELGELRLHAETPRTLRASDLAGASWSVPLHDEDVARAQAALDRVDARLGTARAEPRASSSGTARTVASLVLLATMLGGLWGMPMLVALVGLAAPSAASLATLAVVAMGRALLALGTSETGEPWSTIALWTTIAASLWAAFIAWKWARGPRRAPSSSERMWHRALHALLVFGVVVSVAGLLEALAVSPAVLLGNSEVVAGSITLAGLGVYLRSLSNRLARVGSTSALGVALVGILAGALGDRVSGRSSGLAWKTGRLVPVATRSVGDEVHDVELSPDGTHYLAHHYLGDDHSGYTQQLFAGRIAGGAERSLTALDATFADGHEVLALRHLRSDRLEQDSLVLTLEDLDADSASRVVWRQVLLPMVDVSLRLDARRTRWLVSGRSFHEARHWMSTVGGRLDGGDVRTTHVGADSLIVRHLYAFGDGATLVADLSNRPTAASVPGSVATGILSLLRGVGTTWTISHVDAREKRRLARVRGYPACASADDDTAVCIEQWPRTLRVWRANRGGSMEDLGTLPPRYDRATPSASGLLVASSYRGNEVAIVDPIGLKAIRSSLPAERSTFVREISATDSGVVAVLSGAQGTRIAVYRLR